MMLKFIESEQIDRVKWDECVNKSIVGHIYALSWYLDLVSPNWAGIVEDDYMSVMPLPIKIKFGIKYIYQPLFTQQLGVYGSQPVSQALLKTYFNTIPPYLKYIDYNLNYTNFFSNDFKGISNKVNFELNLNHCYSHLKSGYSRNTARNLKRCIQYVEILENIKVQDLVKLKRENAIRRRSLAYYEWLSCFIHHLVNLGYGSLAGVMFGNSLCAAALFVTYNKRIYYLIPVSNKTGKEKRAMFAIIDYYIHKYSEKDLVLDFEGSNIPGIARFFEGFGAVPKSYPSIKINRLPWWIRCIKK